MTDLSKSDGKLSESEVANAKDLLSSLSSIMLAYSNDQLAGDRARELISVVGKNHANDGPDSRKIYNAYVEAMMTRSKEIIENSSKNGSSGSETVNAEIHNYKAITGLELKDDKVLQDAMKN